MQINTTFKSPNYQDRGGNTISMLVLHATAGSLGAAISWFSRSASQVSCHYIIAKDGRVFQMVPEQEAAWHTGECAWPGVRAIGPDPGDFNLLSLGIELENLNDGRDPYPDSQLASLLPLAQAIVMRYALPPTMVVRHLDIAIPPGRKTDPAGFPWATFQGQLFGRPYPHNPWTYRALVTCPIWTDRRPDSPLVPDGSDYATLGPGGIYQIGDITAGWAWLDTGRGFVPISVLERMNP